MSKAHFDSAIIFRNSCPLFVKIYYVEISELLYTSSIFQYLHIVSWGLLIKIQHFDNSPLVIVVKE